MAVRHSVDEYIQSIKSDEFQPLNKQEEQDMLNDPTLSHEAKCIKLVEHNVRLVSAIAGKYKNSGEFIDLYQIGIVGLHKATQNFDTTRGIKFSTYAYFHVKKVICEYLDKENKNMSSIRNKTVRSFNYNGGVDINGDENSSLEYEVDPQYAPVTTVIDGVFSNQINEIENSLHVIIADRNVLTERESGIIHSRFLSTKKETLQEIGGKLGISHTMVSYLEKGALYKIKQHFTSVGVSSADSLPIEYHAN